MAKHRPAEMTPPNGVSCGGPHRCMRQETAYRFDCAMLRPRGEWSTRVTFGGAAVFISFSYTNPRTTARTLNSPYPVACCPLSPTLPTSHARGGATRDCPSLLKTDLQEGSALVSGSRDNSVKVWDVASACRRHEAENGVDPAASLAGVLCSI